LVGANRWIVDDLPGREPVRSNVQMNELPVWGTGLLKLWVYRYGAGLLKLRIYRFGGQFVKVMDLQGFLGGRFVKLWIYRFVGPVRLSLGFTVLGPVQLGLGFPVFAISRGRFVNVF
jgi:hypothetical protein